MYKEAVIKYCQGCNDKEAGLYALNMRPTGMEDAVDRIRWFQHTNKVMSGRSRKEVRSLSLYSEDDSDFEGEGYSVCQAKVSPSPRRVRFRESLKTDKVNEPSGLAAKVGSLEADIALLRQEVASVSIKMDNVLSEIKSLSRRTRSPTRVGMTRCYNCGEDGHFKASCPKMPKVSQISEDDLNSSGLEEEA